METSHSPRVLEIYVAAECFGCATAHRLAAIVRERSIPNLDVRIVDLSAPDAVRPAVVFAVPTYVLDGRVLSLGNPYEEWLIDRLNSPSDRLDPANHGVAD